MDLGEKAIDVLLEEYRQCSVESLEYSKLQFQLFTIFFVFFGATIGFAVAGQQWVWLLLLMLTPVFLVSSMSLDENQMMNSVHLAETERVINSALSRDVMTWQKTVGYAESRTATGARSTFTRPARLLIVVFAVFAGFPAYFVGQFPSLQVIVFQVVRSGNTAWVLPLKYPFYVVTAVAYVVLAHRLLLRRRSAVDRIGALSSAANRRMDQVRLITGRDHSDEE